MAPCLILTHWGRVTHRCVSKLAIIGADNGLSPGRRQAIIWTNAGILLIVPLGTKFSEILIEIHTFSIKKMHLKMSSAKWRSFCLGLNVLTYHRWGYVTPEGSFTVHRKYLRYLALIWIWKLLINITVASHRDQLVDEPLFGHQHAWYWQSHFSGQAFPLWKDACNFFSLQIGKINYLNKLCKY